MKSTIGNTVKSSYIRDGLGERICFYVCKWTNQSVKQWRRF